MAESKPVYNFDIASDRLGTACIKWDFRAEEFGSADALPFSIADSDFLPCPAVVEALTERVSKSVLGYSDLSDRYRKAVRDWFETRHGWRIEEDWITSVSGIIPAVNAAIASLLKEGSKVVTQTPVYDPFESVIRANNCVSVHNPLIHDNNNRYEMDLNGLEKVFKDGAAMLILCSPHNPVGRVWTAAELKKVIDLCRRYDVILVSDEIHWDLIMPGYTHTSVGSLISPDDRVIVCTAPSKTFNIAGLQASNIIIPNKDLRETYQGWLFSRYLFGANVLGLEACTAAYTKGADWVDAQNAYLKNNADAVMAFLNNSLPKAVVSPLEGTYLMWIDLTYLGKTSDELISAIIEEGAGLNSGRHYGEEGEGFVRLNIACPREMLMKGLESIRRAAVRLAGE